MRLATIPATLWPAPEPRSRIVLYAWYPPTEAQGASQDWLPEEPATDDGDCSRAARSRTAKGR